MSQLTEKEAALELQTALDELSPSVVWSDQDEDSFSLKINVPRGYPGLSTFAKSVLARSLHLADQANAWGVSKQTSILRRSLNRHLADE